MIFRALETDTRGVPNTRERRLLRKRNWFSSGHSVWMLYIELSEMRSLRFCNIEYDRNRIASSTSGDRFLAVASTLSHPYISDTLRKTQLFSATRSSLVVVIIPETVPLQDWTTVTVVSPPTAVQEDNTSWTYPKPSQSKLSCLPVYHLTCLGRCFAYSFKLLYLWEPCHEDRAIRWTLSSNPFHMVSAPTTNYSQAAWATFTHGSAEWEQSDFSKRCAKKLSNSAFSHRIGMHGHRCSESMVILFGPELTERQVLTF